MIARAAHKLGLRLARRLGLVARNEDGNATIEFVILFPVIFSIFMSGAEAGLLEIRFVMLERALDMSVRELRLGQFEEPTHDNLKAEICRLAGVVPDCMNSVMLELRPVDTTTWEPLNNPATCVDRTQELQPATTFNPGGNDEMMLVRVCAVFDPIFPLTGLGLKMKKDASGGYQLVASSAFVNEPK